MNESPTTSTLLVGLLLTAICYMIYPFIRVCIMKKQYDKKQAKKMALWNSIIVGMIFCIALAITNYNATWNAGPAVLYYLINQSIWVSKKKKNENQNNKEKKNTFICGECGATCYEGDKYCKKCKAIFDEEKKEDSKKEELFKCDNCGAMAKMSDTKCPNCGLDFVEDDEEDEYECYYCGAPVEASATKCPNCGKKFVETNEKSNNAKTQNEKEKIKNKNEELFRCDNCGAIVKETAKKCPNCGEKFEDDEIESDMDQKYSDLKKLKKLLDDDIITKEEFEKEKKKILNK